MWFPLYRESRHLTLIYVQMGNLVQRKKKVAPTHYQHLALEGVTSSTWRESQMKNATEQRVEDKFHQIRDGSYPLHMAISSGAPIEVLQILVKAAPDVALKTDKFGQTCLDLVVKCGGTPEAVDLIRSYDPNCEAN